MITVLLKVYDLSRTALSPESIPVEYVNFSGRDMGWHCSNRFMELSPRRIQGIDEDEWDPKIKSTSNDNYARNTTALKITEKSLKIGRSQKKNSLIFREFLFCISINFLAKTTLCVRDDIASTRYDDGANQSSYNAQPIAENKSSDDPPKESVTFEALPVCPEVNRNPQSHFKWLTFLQENDEKNSSIPIAPQHLIGQGKTKVSTSFYTSNSANKYTLRILVPDERIKNLLMSWYYAGYYTGLYEGQHRTWFWSRCEKKLLVPFYSW